MKYKGIPFLSQFYKERKNLQSTIRDKSSEVFVHKQGNLSRYIREDYLLESCKDKNILHFGFADAPFTEERLASNEILHMRLRKVAKNVFGADIDKKAIEQYRKSTKDKNNAYIDITKKIDPHLFNGQTFDVVLLGEIVEHLDNPVQALQNLKELTDKICNKDSYLLITVPNAFNFQGQVAAYSGYEIVHPDHLYYFSPVTLDTLLKRSGFINNMIALYKSPSDNVSQGISSAGVIAKTKLR